MAVSTVLDVKLSELKEIVDPQWLVDPVFGFFASALAVLLVLKVLTNGDFSKLGSLFEYRTKKRNNALDLYLQQPENASSEVLAIVKEQRDTYYFMVATRGIYAEKHFRDALISFQKNAEHRITWITLKQARSYLMVDENGMIEVRRLTIFDNVMLYLGLALFYSIIIFSSLSLFFLTLQMAIVGTVTVKPFILMVLLILVSFSAIIPTIPVSAAKRISKEIARQKRIACG